MSNTLSLPPALLAGAVVTIAIALVAWRVYRRVGTERARRIAAERAAAQSERIAQLTAALGQARTPRTAIEAAVQEPLFALQADAGALLLVGGDGETTEVARAVGYPHQQKPPSPKLTTKSPVADAVGRGAPVIVESRDAWAAEYPDDPMLARGLHQSTVVVPLLIGSRVVAVVHFEFQQPRVFGPDDRQYLGALGTRGAQALDRTWQLEHAERARLEAEALRVNADRELVERKGMEAALRAGETRYRALAARTSRLHALAGALAGAASVEAVSQAVVDHGRIAAGATVGEVILAPCENELALECMRRRAPLYIRSFAEWQERFPQSATAAADGAYESSATLPLLVEGDAIGVIAFHFTAPVNFDEDYETLLMSVAGHCAQALERARLYEATQRARAEAEAANRSKDEFVSIVSHELRTPLGAILGWATMLQQRTLDPAKAARALQSICENASRQQKLIDELLDFSRVRSGRAALRMDTIDVPELIRGVVESMIPAASARRIQLSLAPVPPVRVAGDIRRLEQVLFNLIDNALKFTPEHGHVSIAARVQDGQIELAVADDGAGIEPEFLPFVFDRFRQGDASAARSHGGLGLGMSIAQQLVRAHNGEIAVASEGPGKGTTFTVTLPVTGQLADARPS